MKLIIGLGNPGKAYTYTRHNIGFLVVDKIAQECGARFTKACDGQIAVAKLDGIQCSLLMPLTMMNNSGISVKSAMVKCKAELSDICVVYDDMALGFGTMRVRPTGSAGGHNGIKSIIAHVGSQEFTRIRLGVGRPSGRMDAAEYVLSNFSSGEQKCLPDFINKASLAVHSWVTQGDEATMNAFNSLKKDSK